MFYSDGTQRKAQELSLSSAPEHWGYLSEVDTSLAH